MALENSFVGVLSYFETWLFSKTTLPNQLLATIEIIGCVNFFSIIGTAYIYLHKKLRFTEKNQIFDLILTSLDKYPAVLKSSIEIPGFRNLL